MIYIISGRRACKLIPGLFLSVKTRTDAVNLLECNMFRVLVDICTPGKQTLTYVGRYIVGETIKSCRSVSISNMVGWERYLECDFSTSVHGSILKKC